jgi:hypothetical protein
VASLLLRARLAPCVESRLSKTRSHMSQPRSAAHRADGITSSEQGPPVFRTPAQVWNALGGEGVPLTPAAHHQVASWVADCHTWICALISPSSARAPVQEQRVDCPGCTGTSVGGKHCLQQLCQRREVLGTKGARSLELYGGPSLA